MEQRFTFNAVADAYDAHRPGYPPALFAALRSEASTGAVLEVGCGTGKATEGLLRAGFSVLALDPGPLMLERARARLAGVGPVQFVEAAFETWPAPETPFAMVCAAQAWHWVDPTVGFAKAASLLRRDGAMALFGNVDAEIPEPLGAEFAALLSQALARPAANHALAAYGPGGWIARQWSESGFFGPLEHRVFVHEVDHDAEDYAALVATYSDVQMLDAETRSRLLEGLMQAVARHGGRFVRKLETHLHIARPRPI